MEARFFKISERQLLLDSIARLWRHNHIYVRKPEVLEHLVLNTPYRAEFAGAENYSFVGLWDDDGNVIGLSGVMPQRFNVFGKEYLSTTGTIWIVDEDAKKNLNRRVDGRSMGDFASKHGLVRAGVALGLSKIAYQISKASEAYMIPNLPRWIAINREDDVLKHLLPSTTNPVILPKAHRIECSDKFKIAVDELDKDKWNRYYFNSFAPVTVGTQRDYRFLKWRYMESPVLKYKFVTVLDENDEYCGLAVLRNESILGGKFALGRILEFIAVKAEASIVLANAVLKTFPDVIAWDFYCLSSFTAYGLESVGFRRVPDWMDQVMMPTRFQPVDWEHLTINGMVYLDEDLRYEVDYLATIPWYITRGDADQDRAN